MRTSTLSFAAALAVLPLAACGDQSATPTGAAPTSPSARRDDAAVGRRRYGPPVRVGNGRARAYVQFAGKWNQDGEPVEIGVALDERALEGLPATGGHGGDRAHADELLLTLPRQNTTQYQFVELNWVPAGHEPNGIYTAPHFDFHFYTIGKAERDAIDPADPAFAAKANNLPAASFVPQFNIVPAPPGVPPAALAVPKMGVHWSDVRSPELQGLLGNPAGYRPFTATFIYGSWDGKFIFSEPMITREFLLTKPDVVLPVGTAARYTPAGYYLSAYRIQYDAESKEYRVALTQLTWRS